MKKKRIYRDVSNDIICDSEIERIEALLKSTDNYGLEEQLITNCLEKYPLNNDKNIIAMKIGLIDITNSTHLSQHKSLISIVEIVNTIANIRDIDDRIRDGDPEVVNEIAKSNGKINLFSFASKYCCYHNHNLYKKDDYSIYDTVLSVYLPKYFPNELKSSQIKKWKNSYDYESYNNFITEKLDDLEITCHDRKRKFDHYVWYLNRLYVNRKEDINE